MIPTDTPGAPRLLSISDAVQLLNVSEATVKRLVRDRRLASVKVADRRLIPAEAIDAYIERLKAESAA